MRVREPEAAGRLYPSDATECQRALDSLVGDGCPAESGRDVLVGGLVPSGAWESVGRVCAQVFSALASTDGPSTVVLFGPVHRSGGREAAVFGSGRWETPIGPVEVDDRLVERILSHTNLIVDDPYAHEKHSAIEGPLLFVRHMLPGASVVPIAVRATETALEVGEAVARTLRAYRRRALIVGVVEVDDGLSRPEPTARGGDFGQMVRLACSLDGDALIEHAAHPNRATIAAVAAAVSAARSSGASSGRALNAESTEKPESSVEGVGLVALGQAGIVFA